MRKLIPKSIEPWKRWFAWHPVIIGKYRVWLEVVERKWTSAADQGFYDYRWKQNDKC